MVNAYNGGASSPPSPARREQPPKVVSRYTYTDGPMFYIGQQIIRQMQMVGWDCKIHECYRSPERQRELLKLRRTKAPEWTSPHQYWLAVDIIHKTKAWDVPQRFWDDLNACVKVVAEKHDIELEHGYDWGWDSAHIELKNFRTYRKRYFGTELNSGQLAAIFAEVLPKVWKQHLRSKTAQMKA